MTAPSRLTQIAAMLGDEPNDPELRYMLAMEYVSLGDDAGAVQAFNDLIAVSPEYPPAFHMAARTLQRLGRISEARSLLQRGIPIALKIGNEHAAGEMQGLLETLD
jgi:tetratricopeptide (TPR) repeat protein